MSNSKYVSHSLIGEHLKRAEPRTVSFPPFRGIGPPTHLLGVGRGNLTKIGDAAAVLLIRSVNCSSIISAILRNKIVLLQHTRFIPGKAECWNSSLARVEVVQFSTYCLSYQKEEKILDA